MEITLTPEQLKNLIIFLNRANLTGAEVPAFMEIIAELHKMDS